MIERTCEVKIEVSLFDRIRSLLSGSGTEKVDRDEIKKLSVAYSLFTGVYSCAFSDGYTATMTLHSDEIGYWDELRLYDENGDLVCQEPPEYDLCDREIEYDGTLYKVKIKTFGNLK